MASLLPYMTEPYSKSTSVRSVCEGVQRDHVLQVAAAEDTVFMRTPSTATNRRLVAKTADHIAAALLAFLDEYLS